MFDTIYFFASKKDICNIFHAAEQEFDIKYCVTRADKESNENEMPRMEFNTKARRNECCGAETER